MYYSLSLQLCNRLLSNAQRRPFLVGSAFYASCYAAGNRRFVRTVTFPRSAVNNSSAPMNQPQRRHFSAKTGVSFTETSSLDDHITETQHHLLPCLRDDPSNYGRILLLDDFSTVDGHGIRFLVFLQGCHYRCVFCCNPESWELHYGTVTHISEIMDKIKRCLPYLRATKGGITVSGGDPLVQPDFVANLFRKARELDLSTALDTAGYSSKQGLEANQVAWSKVLPLTDHVMMCIKHPTKEGYKRVSQGPDDCWEISRHFLTEVRARSIPLTIRYVLLPGYTDSAEDLRRLVEIAREQPSFREIELLPYHKLGKYKYDALKLPYPLGDTPRPSKEQINATIRYLEQAGLAVLC